MVSLRRHDNGLLMDLSTTLPDGRVVTTLWPGDRFVLSAQQAHAAHHLERVHQAMTITDYAAFMENGESAL